MPSGAIPKGRASSIMCRQGSWRLAGGADCCRQRRRCFKEHESALQPPLNVGRGLRRPAGFFLSTGTTLMDRLTAPSGCRAQALHCRMVADAVMDEQMRALWVSMAQPWTKLAEAMKQLQPHQGPRGVNGDSPR